MQSPETPKRSGYTVYDWTIYHRGKPERVIVLDTCVLVMAQSKTQLPAQHQYYVVDLEPEPRCTCGGFEFRGKCRHTEVAAKAAKVIHQVEAPYIELLEEKERKHGTKQTTQPRGARTASQ